MKKLLSAKVLWSLLVIAVVIVAGVFIFKNGGADGAASVTKIADSNARAAASCLSSDLAALKNAAYSNQTVGPNTAHFKIGSYKVVNNCARDIRLSNLKVGFSQGSGYANLSNLSNLQAYISGAQVGTTVTNVSGVNNMAMPSPVLASGQSLIVDFYADFGSVTSGVVQTTLLPSGVWGTNVSITPWTTVGGQLITIKNTAIACNGRTTGIEIGPYSTSTANVNSGGGQQGHDLITYAIPFAVTACGPSVYLPTTAGFVVAPTTDKKDQFCIDVNGASCTNTAGNVVASTLTLNAGTPLTLSPAGNYYLPMGQTAQFKVVTTYQPSSAMSARAKLVNVPWSTTDMLPRTGWTINAVTGAPYATPYVAAQ